MMLWRFKARAAAGALLALAAWTAQSGSAAAQLPVVPGTGYKLTDVGDDFEDPNWSYVENGPKASSNLDQQARYPAGGAANGRLMESTYRGQPDVVKRVPTPPGGIPGSEGAMMMRSLYTGVPGRLSNEMQQDDLLMNVNNRIGTISVARTPSVVVRVYLPPFEQWEQRTGSSFGFRGDCHTTITKPGSGRGLFRSRTTTEEEPYWPGFFIQFNKGSGKTPDSAVLLIRCDENGQDKVGPHLTPGWWTLGMSYTPDGKVHYYARQGVENLRPQDHLASFYPYSYRAQTFETMFFNIVNQDNGRNWSTAWIVDDPAVYALHR